MGLQVYFFKQTKFFTFENILNWVKEIHLGLRHQVWGDFYIL
jgi:hypothetical protein